MRATGVIAALALFGAALALQADEGRSLYRPVGHRPAQRRNAAQGQCFPWSTSQSIARGAFAYPDSNDEERKTARRGALINFRCEGVVCPNPVVEDCYMNDDVCAADEWCMLQGQVKFGPWAVAGGQTPQFSDLDCAYMREHGYEELFQEVCLNQTTWGPYRPVRGQCAKYRREQESCNGYLVSETHNPHYAVDTKTGAPPARPLLCGPGLVCTGDLQPVPHTCVKARPAAVCYQGPWWDSASWCAYDGAEDHPWGGLTQEELETTVQALIIQLPVEVYGGPLSPAFWEAPPAQRGRRIIHEIVETLWPEVYRNGTTFPLTIPDPREAGPVYGNAWNHTARQAEELYRQPNKLWSAVHTLIHNCRDPMPREQVEASRSLAVWLRQHFMCCNCRGFWGADVMDAVGLPPDSSAREAHVRWWWQAHNMVSEHSAATRGGHPWIWPAMTDAEFARTYGKQYSELLSCQNPWFLRYSDALKLWDIRV